MITNKKAWRNSAIFFLIVWAILYSVLRFVIAVPNTFDLYIRLSLGCFLIAMVYFYIVTKEKDER